MQGKVTKECIDCLVTEQEHGSGRKFWRWLKWLERKALRMTEVIFALSLTVELQKNIYIYII